MRVPLTVRQRQIVKIVEKLYAENGGIGPTHKQIAERAMISPPAVAQMVNRLIMHGYLERVPFVPRTLRPASSEGGKAA